MSYTHVVWWINMLTLMYTYIEDIVKTVILYEHGGQQNVVVVGKDCAFS